MGEKQGIMISVTLKILKSKVIYLVWCLSHSELSNNCSPESLELGNPDNLLARMVCFIKYTYICYVLLHYGFKKTLTRDYRYL